MIELLATPEIIPVEDGTITVTHRKLVFEPGSGDVILVVRQKKGFMHGGLFIPVDSASDVTKEDLQEVQVQALALVNKIQQAAKARKDKK